MEIDNLIAEALEKGALSYHQKKYQFAESLYKQILSIDPANMEAVEMLSLVLSKMKKHDEAKDIAIKLLNRNKDNYRLYNNLGLIYSDASENESAIQMFNMAIQLKPDEAYLHTNLAIEIKKCDPRRAMSLMEITANRFSDSHHIWFNYGAMAQEFGMFDLAKYTYFKALAIDPEMAICHYNLSAVYFLTGDYKSGWREYEWRWKQFSHMSNIRDKIGLPYWSGESLEGKSIVLYGEQGAGDTIMFARFAKDVKALGARVVMLVIPELYDLFNSCSGVDELTTVFHGNADYQCSLLSVPGILGLGYEDIAWSRYLAPFDLQDGTWDYSGLKVGVCWAGNPMHPNDRNRSFHLRRMEPLSKFNLFSIQKDRRPHVYPDHGVVDYCEGADFNLVDMAEYMTDFNKTAKIIDGLDAVVTADTSLAHLAGALGKKTFMVLPHNPDWRWGLRGESTNWYPSMKIYRQEVAGDWGDVFNRIAEDVK